MFLLPWHFLICDILHYFTFQCCKEIKATLKVESHSEPQEGIKETDDLLGKIQGHPMTIEIPSASRVSPLAIAENCDGRQTFFVTFV